MTLPTKRDARLPHHVQQTSVCRACAANTARDKEVPREKTLALPCSLAYITRKSASQPLSSPHPYAKFSDRFIFGRCIDGGRQRIGRAEGPATERRERPARVRRD